MVIDYVRAVEIDRFQRRKLKNLLLLWCYPDDPRHGTQAGYGYGCRCDRCRAAQSRYKADRRRHAGRD